LVATGGLATSPLPIDYLGLAYRLPFEYPIYTGEPSKTPWVCPFYHISSSSKTQKPNMILKCVQKDVLGTAVRIPVLVNSKVVEPTDEIVWDKTTSKSFVSMRTYASEKELEKVVKKRRVA
jgi:hypothetical protein